MQKFENMDVIAALEAIMHQNTAYYQSDFAYDIKMLREAARSDQPEDKLLLWLSRPSGTFCFRERDHKLRHRFCTGHMHLAAKGQLCQPEAQLHRRPRCSMVFCMQDAAPHTALIPERCCCTGQFP